MNDNDIIKAFDILEKFEFFGGQRAGRELWFNKPADIQNKDIGGFLRDLDFLKTFIKRQKAEIERLKAENKTAQSERDQWYAEYHKVKYDLKQSRMYENSAHKLAEDYIAKFRTARAEAINDFAERLKKKSDYCYLGNIDSLAYRILEKDLNTLVKDMTEEAE